MKKAKQEIKVVEFPPGEIEPLFIAARSVPSVIVGVSIKTLANWRSMRTGPNYHIKNGSVYYGWNDLKEYFSGGKILTHENEET